MIPRSTHPAARPYRDALAAVLHAQGVRRGGPSRYRSIGPDLRQKLDEAARELIGAGGKDTPARRQHLFKTCDACKKAEAKAPVAVSVTSVVHDPAKTFGNEEAAEHGTAVHSAVADALVESRGDPPRGHLRALVDRAVDLLALLGLEPLAVEEPLRGDVDGLTLCGTPDLIALEASTGFLWVVDWSASEARAPKAVQVAGYLTLLDRAILRHHRGTPPLTDRAILRHHRGTPPLTVVNGFVVGLDGRGSFGGYDFWAWVREVRRYAQTQALSVFALAALKPPKACVRFCAPVDVVEFHRRAREKRHEAE